MKQKVRSKNQLGLTLRNSDGTIKDQRSSKNPLPKEFLEKLDLLEQIIKTRNQKLESRSEAR